MAKTKIYRPRLSSNDIRKKIKFYYMEKFFNKWMNKYDFTNLNYQQKHYIMKSFWSKGTVACAQISVGGEMKELMAGLKIDIEEFKEDSLIFTPWAPANLFNIYDFPTKARLINVRGVDFIPEKELVIDKEVVIGYAQKNHKSVFSSIEAKIEELVDIEMKKRVSRKAQSQPWMFAFSPEDYEQAMVLQQQLESDEPFMFVPFQEVDKVKALVSGAPYIVDKFEQDRQKVENDILTMLGVNNVGIGEKKEHLIVDEVNANNEDIEQQSTSYRSEIENFFERVYNVFGYRVDVIDLNEVFKEAEDEVDEKEEDTEYVDEN